MSDSILLKTARSIQSVVEEKGGSIAFLSEINEQSHILHDIDIIVNDQGWCIIPEVINTLSEHKNLDLVQLIQYDVGRSLYCVFLHGEISDQRFVKIDFLNDSQGIGTYGINSDLLLRTIVAKNGINRPAANLELSYLLAKRIVKGTITEDQFLRMVALDSQRHTEAISNFCKLGIRNSSWNKLLLFLTSKDYQAFRSEIFRTHRSWSRLRYVHHLDRLPLRLLAKISRLKNRLKYPVGMKVFFTGNDINTNLTKISELESILSIPFRGRIRVLTSKKRLNLLLRDYLIIKGYLILNYKMSSVMKCRLQGSSLIVQTNPLEEIVNTLKARAKKRVAKIWLN